MKTLLVCLTLLISTLTYADADELGELFEKLNNADSHRSAVRIERQIWAVWDIGPSAEATDKLERAVKAMNSGEYTLALVLLDQLVEQAPDYSEAWNKRATLYYMMGDFQRSIADIEQTVLLEPRHFGAWSGLGLILEMLNRTEAAIRAHETVLKIYPMSMFSQQKLEQLKEDQLEKSI